jgi:hypothetical protein
MCFHWDTKWIYIYIILHINIWSQVPRWARRQDILTDSLNVTSNLKPQTSLFCCCCGTFLYFTIRGYFVTPETCGTRSLIWVTLGDEPASIGISAKYKTTRHKIVAENIIRFFNANHLFLAKLLEHCNSFNVVCFRVASLERGSAQCNTSSYL